MGGRGEMRDGGGQASRATEDDESEKKREGEKKNYQITEERETR